MNEGQRELLRSLIVLSAALLAAAPSLAAAQTCSPGTEVRIETGLVCGIVSGDTTQWLGIPYAAPPVGALRWQAPQPHSPWSTTLSAVQKGAACTASEDCLFVNVIEPTQRSPDPLPVMVWIHGGGFVGGEGAIYDGSHLATAGGVVFVSMNYRLGVLGFLAHEAFGPHSGNYGLEDQQAALRWVRRNIGAFGGDPNNVTIFGESAGGSSICDQLASPTAAGLFDKAISQSGQYNSVTGVPTGLQPQDCKAILPTHAEAVAAGDSFANTVGCSSAPDVAACLRNLPASTVRTTPGTAAPTIDGETLTMSPRRAFASGAFNRVATIIGVLQDENLVASPKTVADYKAQVQKYYGDKSSEVLELYPVEVFDSPFIAFREVSADSNTVCPGLKTAENISRYTTVFAYQIDDTDAPLLGPFYPDGSVPNGAYHAAEHAMLFPGSVIVGSPPAVLNQNQAVLSRQMTAEWTMFARTGDPTATKTPVWLQFEKHPRGRLENRKRLEWPVMSLQPAGDSHLTTADAIAAIHNCEFWDRFWDDRGEHRRGAN
jgi:para-nitrobenzyl esterase